MTHRADGIAKDAIRANNIFAILARILKNGPTPRRDLAKQVGLTPATVTLLVADMIARGLLVERGEIDEGPRAGRRMVPVDIDHRFGYLLGVCVEPARLSLAISHLNGEPIAKRVLPSGYGQAELLERLLDLSGALLRETRPEGRFCAVGVSISGYVDPDAGVSVDSYGVLPPGARVAEAFERRFGVPAFLDNNVRSLALAEIGMDRSRTGFSGLFIKHDPGFGCAVVLGGEVYEGATNRSGEIGHARVVENGRRCICGKTGCLSTVVGTEALVRGAATAFSPGATPALWRECAGLADRIDVPALVRCAAEGDAPIARMLAEAARAMARVLETTLLTVDGDTVVTFGSLFEDDWFFSLLGRELSESFGGFREIRMARSHVRDLDRWRGAVFIAQRRFLKAVSMEFGGRAQENSA